MKISSKTDSKHRILSALKEKEEPVSLKDLVTEINEKFDDKRLLFLSAKQIVFELKDEGKISFTNSWSIQYCGI